MGGRPPPERPCAGREREDGRNPGGTAIRVEILEEGETIALPEVGEVEILIPAERIATRVAELGARISRAYAGRNPLFVSILKGGIVFLSDLMRAVTIPHEIDFLAVSSYGSRTESSGRVRLLHDLGTEVRGRDVLLVEDVVDTGLTIRFLLDYLELRGPASLRVCTLLQKAIDDIPAVEAEFIGFRIPNRYVIGYGMDLAGHYRNLPFVAALVDGGTTGAGGRDQADER